MTYEISTQSTEHPPWQWQLKHAITTPEQLLAALSINPEQLSDQGLARRLFPLRVPRAFVEKMVPGDIHDPLFRQVWPDAQEFIDAPGYVADPLQEHGSATPGLIHKYKSRVLLVVRGGCAINCRYCFRRHFPYAENKPGEHRWQDALSHIANHSEINEVILSGGDPLMANDQQLFNLLNSLEQIPHLKRIRIHSRMPVVIPERLTDALKQRLANARLKTILVLHVNHANEIDDRLSKRLLEWKKAGIWLLNQAVILKGINDSVAAQVDLSEALFDGGIQPYYLHAFDPVSGAAHFDVDDDTARQICQGMLAELPGFLVPKLVREIPDRSSKTPLDLKLRF
ncbi:EF-P beta-lysylation protein EpmB [Echinimonas agarilytica]|uniref:L-lysine 2,3-aminomutase n=1 Tax=Echinimonas agarilytica TaxID=1215918 RepID=A0AA41W4B2_9GAMM|nr:EF-P beta-lysylation protein EpmB [Echinimonas agarilytica]MCM2678423.1 EF-P beta-lysylation protein EpmB [Echinimonas agarilytica]